MTANKSKKNAPDAIKAIAKKPSKNLVNKRVSKAKAKSTGLTQTDPLLQAYLREVQKYPLLTREKEHELALEYFEKGNKDALHLLVTSNLRFVVKIAFEYLQYRGKVLDLIQEGNMGLVKAVQEFNPYKEVRLTTYAVWWIRSYIQEAILKNHSLVKLGTTQAQKRLFYRLRAEQKKLEQMGISPQQNVKLLASRLDVKEKEVEEMDQRLAAKDVSLNAPMSDEDKGERIQNLADPAQAADETLGNAEQSEIFSRVLKEFAATLEGRDKEFFQNRLIAEEPMTLQELGDKFGVTKERARQIEEQIKAKLKSYVEEHFPDFQLLTEGM